LKKLKKYNLLTSSVIMELYGIVISESDKYLGKEGKMRTRDNFGVHIVSDLYGCEPEKLMRMEEIEEVIETAIRKSQLNKIKSHFHQFKPYGVTGFVLLSESHLAIHTWPEHGYVSLDVYSCGPPDNSFSAHKRIIDFFRPNKVSTNIFMRGKLDESQKRANIEAVSQRT